MWEFAFQSYSCSFLQAPSPTFFYRALHVWGMTNSCHICSMVAMWQIFICELVDDCKLTGWKSDCYGLAFIVFNLGKARLKFMRVKCFKNCDIWNLCYHLYLIALGHLDCMIHLVDHLIKFVLFIFICNSIEYGCKGLETFENLHMFKVPSFT